jgi:uncharacterized membrane protein
LADADQLVKLDAAHPGTIDRVLDYVDREQSHRHQMHNAWNDREREQMAETIVIALTSLVLAFIWGKTHGR